MKILIVLLIMASSSAHAFSKLICVNRGNLAGSYSLDITGYEMVLDGTESTMLRTLNFKHFRSFEEAVSNVLCTKPNPYLDGPNAILACRSGEPANDYGPRGPTPYEAIIYRSQSKLTMTVTGPDIDPATDIYCQLGN